MDQLAIADYITHRRYTQLLPPKPPAEQQSSNHYIK